MGVYAQEGEGPVGGNAIKMDLIIASRDVVAADATACRIMGINPYEIQHIKIAEERGFGNANNIEIVGEDISNVKRKFSYPLSNFKRIKYKILDFGMDFASHLGGTTEEKRAYEVITKLMRTKPVISKECRKCQRCIGACPVGAIDNNLAIDYRKCKACMICVEASPFHAIKSKEISLLLAIAEMTICVLRVASKAIRGKLYK